MIGEAGQSERDHILQVFGDPSWQRRPGVPAFLSIRDRLGDGARHRWREQFEVGT